MSACCGGTGPPVVWSSVLLLQTHHHALPCPVAAGSFGSRHHVTALGVWSSLFLVHGPVSSDQVCHTNLPRVRSSATCRGAVWVLPPCDIGAV